MAIKISGSTIVDDSRQLVNVGTSTVSASSNLHVGAGITMYGASGIISATSFYGSGQNLTDLIGSKIQGLTIQNAGSTVGTASSVASINFAGNGVTAAASGVGDRLIIRASGSEMLGIVTFKDNGVYKGEVAIGSSATVN